MNKVNTITIKIDEDNDIYEMTINNVVYTLDNVYQSEYSQLFDELNMSIEVMQFTLVTQFTYVNSESRWNIYQLIRTNK